MPNVGFSGTSALINSNKLSLSGGYDVTLTETGTTNVTLPTSGTLATSVSGVSNFVVSTVSGQGNYTTLAAAMAAASAGDTIFLKTSVTENVTITPGVNIVGWSGVGDSGSVSITGTLTMTGAGTSTVSNLRLTTNSAAVIAVTGSSASVLNIENCYINATNNTAITYSSSSASSILTLQDCQGNLGTTGIAYFSHSSAGILSIRRCVLSNSGGSSTANTVSAGQCIVTWSSMFNPITSSGSSALLNGFMSTFDCSSTNSTAITHGSTAASQPGYRECEFYSGSASAISISASCSLPVVISVINSSNTNAITGSGTLSRGHLVFTGSSSTINTTTVTQLKSLPKVAPTVQTFTSGTAATYTTPANCQWIRIRMVGGGGGAAGSVATAAGTASAGGGGGAGGYVEHIINNPSATYTYTVGNGGAAGAAGGSGGDGGDTTFSTLTAGGGLKSVVPGGAAGAAGISSYGGAGGTASGGNVANIPGSSGQHGIAYPTSNGAGGKGGASLLGGVQNYLSDTAGVAGQNYGSGGSGGGSAAGAGARAGSAGSAGYIIVEEYYL